MEAFGRLKAASHIPLFVQCRTKFNTRQIKPVHLERRILEAITQPIYRENVEDKAKTCSVLKYRKYDALSSHKPTIKENLYENFLVREARKVLSESSVIIVFQPDSMNMRRKTAIHNMFVPIGLEPIYFPCEVIGKAIADTKLRNLKSLIHRQMLLVVGKLDSLTKLFDVTGKIPDIVLLGGVFGDRIFTKQGLINCAALPELDGIRGQFVGILGSSPQQTRSYLGFQQQNLSRLLDQYVTQLKDHNYKNGDIGC